MSGWRRCEKCRKVKAATDFEADATTCQACLTSPAPVVRKKTSTVTRSTTAPRPPAAAPAERGPRLGSIGSGDLEVRERRARRTAHDVLAELHADEFAVLLAQARAAEGLRALSAGMTPPAPEEA